ARPASAAPSPSPVSIGPVPGAPIPPRRGTRARRTREKSLMGAGGRRGAPWHRGGRLEPEAVQKFHFGSQLGLWAAFMYAAAFAARSGCWAATFVVSPGSSVRLYNSGVALGALFTLLRTAFQGPKRTAWARPALWYSQ